jgi:hypothetical protein
MFWEVLLVAVLTYGVLLPYMASISKAMHEAALEIGADIPQTDGKYGTTLIMKLHEWFIRLSIPLAILMLFHGTRARREIRFPETEAKEPTITKAEYDARRLAAAAAAEEMPAEDDASAPYAAESADEPPCEVQAGGASRE